METEIDRDRKALRDNFEYHAVLARMALEIAHKSELKGGCDAEALDSVVTQLEDARCFYEGVASLIEDARRRLIAAEQVD